ncbi:unnamed protein product [Dovyalis caffra]|uniref:Uncharacterized protein n=1 Tax=Dovyalis caffra TaxID=77055 RepID=A0AAV1R946_9ROSI|nr:unnamed protein product [Dovyalis caffra]
MCKRQAKVCVDGGGPDDSTKGVDRCFLKETNGDGTDDSGEGGLKVAKGHNIRLLNFKGRGIWIVDVESEEVEIEAKSAIYCRKPDRERERVAVFVES